MSSFFINFLITNFNDFFSKFFSQNWHFLIDIGLMAALIGKLAAPLVIYPSAAAYSVILSYTHNNLHIIIRTFYCKWD